MLQKVKLMLKPVGNWSLFTASIVASFFIGYYYPALQKSMNHENGLQKFVQPKTLEQVSVSVTDRGELLIISRSNGMCEVYDETVGIAVFKAYGYRITSNQPK